MIISLNTSQITKISIILFLFSIIIPLFLFYGTMDDFAPKHIATIEDLSNQGNLIEHENQVVQVPGFYILGAIIIQITGIASESLLDFPIQIIPYVILLFILIYRISGNFFVAVLIAFIDIISGSTGTPKVFFWPHGIGYILFFTIILLILLILKKEKPPNILFLLVVIIGSALVYISYNLMAMTLIFLLVLLLILILLPMYSNKKEIYNLNQISLKAKNILFLLIILLIIQLGLSKFVYNVFIPTIQATRDIEISGLDKFLIAYLNPDVTTISMGPLMVHYPVLITIISGIKYGFIAITIIFFCVFFLKKTIKENIYYQDFYIVIAVIVMLAIYSIPRSMIGGIILTALWLPGILTIAIFFKMPSNYRVWASIVILVLLISTPLYFITLENNSFINREATQINGYKAPVHWFLRYNDGTIAVSDELTKNYFILNSFLYITDQPNSEINLQSLSQSYKLLPTEDAQVLARSSDKKIEQKYIILNKKLTILSLQNWIIIKSWNYSKERIMSNKVINQIYDSPLLSIDYTSSI